MVHLRLRVPKQKEQETLSWQSEAIVVVVIAFVVFTTHPWLSINLISGLDLGCVRTSSDESRFY